jgi:hypothetical protein
MMSGLFIPCEGQYGDLDEPGWLTVGNWLGQCPHTEYVDYRGVRRRLLGIENGVLVPVNLFGCLLMDFIAGEMRPAIMVVGGNDGVFECAAAGELAPHRPGLPAGWLQKFQVVFIDLV